MVIYSIFWFQNVTFCVYLRRTNSESVQRLWNRRLCSGGRRFGVGWPRYSKYMHFHFGKVHLKFPKTNTVINFPYWFFNSCFFHRWVQTSMYLKIWLNEITVLFSSANFTNVLKYLIVDKFISRLIFVEIFKHRLFAKTDVLQKCWLWIE